MKKIILILLLAFLILLALFPRSVEILNSNPVFGYDHGRDYLKVRDIVINHKFTLIGAELGAGGAGISYLFQGPAYYYMMSIPFILWQGNPIGAIYVMWTLSIFALVVAFYMGKKIGGIWGGLLAFGLLACADQFIAQARLALNSHTTAFFILLAFYHVYLYIKTKKDRYAFLSAFLTGFIYNFEFAVSFPMCIALVLLAPFVSKKKIKQYVLLLLGFIAAFSPMILFEVRHGFLGLRNAVLYVFGPHTKSDGITLMFRWLHLQDVWGSFFYNFANTFPGNGVVPGLFLLITFCLLFFWYITKEKDAIIKTFLLYLFSLTPISFVVFNIFRNSVYEHYIAELSISYILILTGIISYFIVQKYNKVLFILSLYGLVLLGVAAYSSYKTTVYDYQDYGGTAKLKGKIDAIDYIYHDAKGQPFSLFVFSPRVYTYPYDYILLWHAEPLYHYLPGKTKKGVFYLLIDKDPTQPWTYKGWLETVIKSGKVIYTKTLPSGFIVQKRIGENNEK